MNQQRSILAKQGRGAGHALGLLAVLAVFVVLPESAWPAKIGDVAEETSLGQQAIRFFSFRDPSVRYAVIGSVLLGISCGLLGCFIVVRKMALVGDTLSHAVLPGVALGFLFSGVSASGLLDWSFDVANITKNPSLIFCGAVVAGVAGTFLVNTLKQTTKIKEDSALGLTLASFFAVGICLLTMIQRLPTGNKSGIDKFMFGQAAAIGEDDIRLMTGVTLLIVVVVFVFYKELLVTSFDSGLSSSLGINATMVHYALMAMLSVIIVSAFEAVGAILVIAMLILPGATASLLAHRLPPMFGITVLHAALSAIGGIHLATWLNCSPAGAMVVAGSVLFALAWVFSPSEGLLRRWLGRELDELDEEELERLAQGI